MKLLRLNFSYTLCNGYILCLQCSEGVALGKPQKQKLLGYSWG